MTEIIWAVIRLLIGQVGSFYIIASITVFLQSFYDNGIRWSRKKALIIGIYIIAETVIGLLLQDQVIMTVLFLPLYLMIPLIGCKGKIIRRALRVILTYFVSMMTVSTVSIFGFVYLMPGFDVNSESFTRTEELVTNLICVVFFAFVFHYIKIRLVDKGIFIRCGKKENFALAAYSVFAFFMLVMAVISVEEPELIGGVLVVFALVCLIALTAFPLLLYHGRISSHYKSAVETHEAYMQSQLEHFRQYRSAQEETARFRHDIQNNLQCISDLLSSGKEKEAGEYFSALLSEVRALSPKYVSGDEILDCIISSKASLMEREGITFSFDGVIPGGLGWNAIDVCNVFANALDNAIEANMKIPEGQRYVAMTIKSAEMFRYIRMENPISEAFDVNRLFNESGGFTTKKHGSAHGMGTYSIKRTAEKYGGVVRAECTAGVFALELIINKGTSQ